jgi:NAD(P)-dependent dehydrogenase (short-subunit alcohol dehydrogenase family)
MNLELDGKLALITGGSKGIGFASARALLAEGAKVVIVSSDQANVDKAVKRLSGATGYAADLVSAQAADRVVVAIERELGSIDILVNCAGAARRTPPDELRPEHWRAAMDAKYFSYINVTDPLIKRMALRGSGVIINVIGAGGKIASPIHLPGGAANAALMLATAGLANAYASRGVRVVGINPGNTETERLTEGLKAEAAMAGISDFEAMARAVGRIPLGRMAKPEEIADMIAFLSSARATYVTGVVINMDGAATPMIV